MYTSKVSNLFTTSEGQASVQPFPEKQGSITFNSNLGIQTPSFQRSPLPPNFPTSSFFPFCPVIAFYNMGHLGSALLVVSSLNFFCTPSLFHCWWDSLRNRNDCEQIQNITPYKLLWRKLTLSQPQPMEPHCLNSLRQQSVKKIDKERNFLYKSESSLKLSQNIDLPVKTFRAVAEIPLNSAEVTHSFRGKGSTHSLLLLRKRCLKQISPWKHLSSH